MSERYGACRSCKGRGDTERGECGICGGTGFSGDAMDYVDPAYRLKVDKSIERTPRKTHKEVMDSVVSAMSKVRK